ncbi:MAG: exodeoxyribonuclease VII large subunit [Deltaproteobacteria bacterium]|nr:exodeoxyribonuclease VII large subunit [Deltaproteobacteria bacterium]
MDLPLRYVLTVSELTQEIKAALEVKFSDVWVEGEISNLKVPPSGHLYFTLKDDFSQIRVVLFRMKSRAIRFVPEDGLHVVCRGRVGLYEKRGEYQLIIEEMEPKGIGALQLAFLQLKERLEKEGLFDISHKKPIPTLPQTIGIVTSPTGAVIQDMIQIIHRRFENVTLLLYPVRVQGEGASGEIAEGIRHFNRMKNVDVIIVGRGGGSLEDLWAFNEEEVARAIHHSKIPVVSAVGHETDYTISDFVADLRAPTPSAAAELVVKDKRELKKNLHHLKGVLENQMTQYLQEMKSNLFHFKKGLIDPRKMIEDYLLRLDDLVNQSRKLLLWNLTRRKEKRLFLAERLNLQSPFQRIKNMETSLSDARKWLGQNMRHKIQIKKQNLKGILGKLDSLSPLSILQRGYSITRKLPSLKILRDAAEVLVGDKVEVKLHRGTLSCCVEGKERS